MTSYTTSDAERIFGKYHVVRPLKIGGTAAIYLAVMRGEDNFSREVVIKRPLAHLVADTRSRKMFLDEAHIASRLNHPNICQVLDLVAREHEIYLVLEYLRGVDLREILKRCIELGRLMPPEVAVWMGVEVCAGLDFAHESVNLDGQPLHLVHRDVSPKNIRITHAGSVKVIDFGIAWAHGRQTETAAGTIKGTLGYMSPEQILGDEIDRRSDVFAFGICLFQMLTNRNPFDGPNLKERVRRLTQAPVPSVREYNPALDDEIEAIVARCLERDISRRYPRMRDVQADLERYLARLQVVSPRQVLVRFLEDIFPNIHQMDEGLATAFSEISRVTGRIDTAQRLIFPDDPPTEPHAAQGTLPDATGATRPQGGTTEAQRTSATVQETRATAAASRPPVQEAYTEAGATRPLLLTDGPDTVAVPPPGTETAAPPAASSGRWLLPVALGVVVLAAVLAAAFWPRPDEVLATSLDPQAARVVGQAPAVGTEPFAMGQDAGVTVAPPPTAPPPAAPPPGAVTPATAVRPPPTTVAPPPPRVVRPPTRRKPIDDRQRSRMFFRTARRLQQGGRTADAELLYQLAYAYGGARPDAAVFLNLGLMYNQGGDAPKAKACLRGFLERSPDDPNAPRVRTLISSYPSTRSVDCVSRAEASAAMKRYARNGTAIDGWVQDTMEGMLR
ncbi:MAG: serine/threonine protein kinase [Deltaproteobacteria bacterium]|nr:serine/threonine protein kinase [Deltaproteobacteria bacterium]